MNIREIIELAFEKRASDIHLEVGRPITFRLNGDLVSISDKELSEQDTEEYMRAITDESHRQKIDRVGGVDFGFAYAKTSRLRVSAFRQKSYIGMVLRLLPNRFFDFDAIGIPEKVVQLLNRPRGLILVTGPTGSGKSTTLATMIDYINANHPAHIVTIEDPIEFVHEHKRGIIVQREVGVDVPSFSEAVVKSLRQDPDVLLIGEMRDLATMEAAITAAETGHLVFATLHTTGAARTVDRVIDVFPSHQQAQIRVQLSVTLIAVVSQALIPRIDQDGRVAAFEIMIQTPAISNLIRENKTFQIFSEIQTGHKFGMRTLDSHLIDLYAKGIISYESALETAYDQGQFIQQAAKSNVLGPVSTTPTPKKRWGR
ncbi:MAG: type IV pili twitching motility protein PilT [Candidatus Omnitrophica bacterium CG11_big_fil_rev_8_21_14_0_20_45_26]|uniref:Type IV pili twitching motility protein PilT n=1 Tax=Candidatus Abzuiibacterium crystallinum TaxID=1974748 RepID=A0A2H0LMF4_9BACT|nr:MAG: type IV pili twitching motility protein PilT [Candidatus Omnitrophica bacterium CG11_big_fil_rev_8_21_14_0_20_45_26]PIW63718.1 MAG: type IV pili twitching motility protein PilT [Candidatus Omnitrophica bacterium CG12_big_fil_rev_8_21_14_0_65_45_16]